MEEGAVQGGVVRDAEPLFPLLVHGFGGGGASNSRLYGCVIPLSVLFERDRHAAQFD